MGSNILRLRARKANVEAGRFHFVVLMDQMDERLKTLITYMNASSRFTILGVELDFYRHGDLDILIPRLYGAEGKKQDDRAAGRQSRQPWTEERFFERVAENVSPEQAPAVREMYDWASGIAEIGFATGVNGGFTANFPDFGGRRLFKINSEGKIVIRVSQLGELGAAFRDALNQSGVFQIGAATKKPVIRIEDWLPHRERFIAVVEAFVKERRGMHASPQDPAT
jgi:hypothetical protein